MGVVDDAVLEHERAQARPLARIGGRLGSGHGAPLGMLMAFPAVLLAIALMSVFGTGAVLLATALAVVYTPVMARVVRAAVLATKVEVYVDGARALGATVHRCWSRPRC
jgi:peptide/nickel transport system permease protein